MDSDVARVPESNCLRCGREMNALGTSREGIEAQPKPGNLAICIHCGGVMKLDENLRLRGMTDPEMDAVMADEELMTELARMLEKIHYVKHMTS